MPLGIEDELEPPELPPGRLEELPPDWPELPPELPELLPELPPDGEDVALGTLGEEDCCSGHPPIRKAETAPRAATRSAATRSRF